MNDVSNADLRPAAAAFQKSAGPKMDTLLPHRIAVRELRGKGASFPIIARLLERIGVHVSTDTTSAVSVCTRPLYTADDTQAAAVSTTVPAPAAISTRGPRIADPFKQ
jgi:hypothetical protein